MTGDALRYAPALTGKLYGVMIQIIELYMDRGCAFHQYFCGCRRGRGRKRKGDGAERKWSLHLFFWACCEELHDCHPIWVGRYLTDFHMIMHMWSRRLATGSFLSTGSGSMSGLTAHTFKTRRMIF